jgi:hypothetical protein
MCPLNSRSISLFYGQGKRSFADQLLLSTLDGEYLCFGDYDVLPASKDNRPATQAVRSCRTQVVHLEFDGKHILVEAHCTPCCAPRRVVRKGGQHPRVYEPMLLHVLLVRNHGSFTCAIVDKRQFHPEMANKTSIIEDAPHTGFSILVHKSQ